MPLTFQWQWWLLVAWWNNTYLCSAISHFYSPHHSDMLVWWSSSLNQIVTSPSGRAFKKILLSVSSSDINISFKACITAIFRPTVCYVHNYTISSWLLHQHTQLLLSKQVYTPFVFAEGSCCFLPKVVSDKFLLPFVVFFSRIYQTLKYLRLTALPECSPAKMTLLLSHGLVIRGVHPIRKNPEWLYTKPYCSSAQYCS